ncbi:MAG: ABC transporter permease [Anaerolineaceae bacterium]|nr:ABC transporter permease [Anaerolineaceae bacterium]
MAFPIKGFTTRWYMELWKNKELMEALKNSLFVGLVSSLIATLIGTLAAISITRFNYRLRGLFINISSLPLVIPYVVLAVCLLILFRSLGIHLNLWTVIIGYVVINIPYVILIVAARLVSFPANIEEAAIDLGANYFQALVKVILPNIFPSLLASFLSSFVTSFDEFSLGFFLTGTQNILPVYLYSQLRFPSRIPIALALAAILLIGSLIILVFAEWLRKVDFQYIWSIVQNDK